jgi:uncharacterized protein
MQVDGINDMEMFDKVDTPCIGKCYMQDGNCIGCKRTLEEVSNWFTYTPVQRKEVMETLKDRHG